MIFNNKRNTIMINRMKCKKIIKKMKFSKDLKLEIIKLYKLMIA